MISIFFSQTSINTTRVCFLLFSQIIILFVCLLIAVAFFSLAERKVIASIQRRIGPNIIGVAGVLQPFADGLKLLVKETILP